MIGNIGAVPSCLLAKILSEGLQSFPWPVCVRLCPRRTGPLLRGEFGHLWVTSEVGGGISVDTAFPCSLSVEILSPGFCLETLQWTRVSLG